MKKSRKSNIEPLGICEICFKPTSHRGWNYIHSRHRPFSLKTGYKRYHWWCNEHFLIHMFNLWPYLCTEKCQGRHGKQLGIQMRLEQKIIWINLSTVLVPASKVWMNKSIPMKSLDPKCPWCGKKMKLYEKYFRTKDECVVEKVMTS